jgi:hypothetical protein
VHGNNGTSFFLLSFLRVLLSGFLSFQGFSKRKFEDKYVLQAMHGLLAHSCNMGYEILRLFVVTPSNVFVCWALISWWIHGMQSHGIVVATSSSLIHRLKAWAYMHIYCWRFLVSNLYNLVEFSTEGQLDQILVLCNHNLRRGRYVMRRWTQKWGI